jgi:hypothetical protein
MRVRPSILLSECISAAATGRTFVELDIGDIFENLLTLSSSVMPYDIIFLILPFICYNFGGLERVNPFQPPKIIAYEEQN